MPDIDIDLPPQFNPKTVFSNIVTASMIRDGNLVKHPCGQYFQHIPIDSCTNLAAIPYKEAEELGFFKFDFLHLSMLEGMISKQEIKTLISQDPDWNMLLDRTVVYKLHHINKHFDLVYNIRPTSVQELADCLALIRPSKQYLQPRYINTPKQHRHMLQLELYKQPTSGKMWFKKSHSIAYALNIILQLHLIKQNRL